MAIVVGLFGQTAALETCAEGAALELFTVTLLLTV